MTDATPTTPAVPWTEKLARNKQPCGIAVLLLGLLLTVLAILFWRQWMLLPSQFAEPHPYHLPLSLWATFVALMGLAGGGLLLTVPDPPAERRDTITRLCVLVATGGFGFITTFLGLALGIEWLGSVEKWSKQNDSEEGKYVVGAMLVFFVGLAIIFAGLQAARTEERKNSALRRILYGYNAVFTGLLLLIGLTVANVFVWESVPRALVTTQASLISLDENSKKLLKAIDQPVHVYLIMPEELPITVEMEPGKPTDYTALYTDCRALLRQCEDLNPKFHAVYYSPTLNADQIRQLSEKYKIEAKQLGMLVVVGDEPAIVRFIPYTALYTVIRGLGFAFQGEPSLMTELADILGGARPVIYFTQSNGECQIQASSKIGAAGQSERKAERIEEYLRLSRFDVRPLTFEAGKIPNLDDATAVIIPGPTVPFRPDQVEVLTNYLAPKDPKKKPGKLLAFLPPFPDATGKVAATGLEELLVRYGVVLHEAWLVAPEKDGITGSDTMLISSGLKAYAGEAGDPIPLEMSNLRFISTPQNREVVPFFHTVPGALTIQETQINISPKAALENLWAANKKQDIQYIFDHTLVGYKGTEDSAVIVGVGVMSKAETDNTRLHWLMAVLTSDTLVNDSALDKQPHPDRYMATVRRMVDLLREKQSFAVPPRKLPEYELRKDISQTAVLWMPTGLILLTIIGLGVGVWMVRRG